ncbi:MAG: HlyD family secretion protein [Bacteroidales bacterium]
MKVKQIGIASLLLLCSGLLSCESKEKQPDAYGNFEVDEVIVSAQSNGQLLTFDLREGDLLASGTMVGQIDTIDLTWKKRQLLKSVSALEAQIPDIASQINVIQARLNNALIEQKRIRELQSSDAATLQQLDNANTAVTVLEKEKTAMYAQLNTQTRSILAQIEPLRMQLGQVEEQLLKCRVVTPVSGTVLTKIAQMGEVTAYGKPLFVLADLSRLQIRAYISEPQLSQIKLGQTVKVAVDAPDHTFIAYDGVITWISSQAEFTPKIVQTRDERVNLVYAFKVDVKNDGSLKIGMPGEVYFNSPQ